MTFSGWDRYISTQPQDVAAGAPTTREISMPVQRSEVTTVNEMIRGDLGHFHFFDARTSHGRGVFSGFLVGTNRMLALATASQSLLRPPLYSSAI
jgi:hypothetical protein